MTLWRIRTLVDRLRSSPLTAREVMSYLIAVIAACTLVLVFTNWSRPWDRDEFEAAVDSLTTLAGGLISGAGLYCCYRANRGADGLQFADRVCAIGFVLFVRFVVFSTLAFILWAYLTVAVNSPFRPSYEDLDLLFLLIVTLFWFRLRSHIASVARR